MTYLRAHYKTIILALAIATVFATVDLYVLNVSSYVCGFLLAGVLLERKKPAVREIKPKTGGEPMKCVSPCNGNLKKVAARKPGGVEQYKCPKCHRKYILANGKLRQVAV